MPKRPKKPTIGFKIESYCFLCQKDFGRRADLNRHMEKTIIHQGDAARRFPCHICTQRFTQRANIAQHIKAVHGADYLPPELRKRKFRDASERRRARKRRAKKPIKRETASPVLGPPSPLATPLEDPLPNIKPTFNDIKQLSPPYQSTDSESGRSGSRNPYPVLDTVPSASTSNGDLERSYSSSSTPSNFASGRSSTPNSYNYTSNGSSSIPPNYTSGEPSSSIPYNYTSGGYSSGPSNYASGESLSSTSYNYTSSGPSSSIPPNFSSGQSSPSTSYNYTSNGSSAMPYTSTYGIPSASIPYNPAFGGSSSSASTASYFPPPTPMMGPSTSSSSNAREVEDLERHALNFIEQIGLRRPSSIQDPSYSSRTYGSQYRPAPQPSNNFRSESSLEPAQYWVNHPTQASSSTSNNNEVMAQPTAGTSAKGKSKTPSYSYCAPARQQSGQYYNEQLQQQQQYNYVDDGKGDLLPLDVLPEYAVQQNSSQPPLRWLPSVRYPSH